MEINRLVALADAYGASFRRWPENERVLDSRVMAYPAARAALARASVLDALLDAAPPHGPSTDLTARVNQALSRVAAYRICGVGD